MTRYSSTMTDPLQEIREGFSPKQIKMAIGIASDKRYVGGNMTERCPVQSKKSKRDCLITHR